MRGYKGLITAVAALTITSVLASCGSDQSEEGAGSDQNNASSASSGTPDSSAEDTAAAEDSADDFPSGAITLIVPYGAGGGTDVVARALAPIVQEELGVEVLVRNEPGGGTIPALNKVLDDPSGQTLIFEGAGIVGMKPLGKGDLTPSDFQPVIVAQAGLPALGVAADSEWETFEQFAAAVKEKPGSIKVGTSQTGGQNHASATLLESSGFPIGIVPFDSGATAAITALLGDRVDSVMTTVGEFAQYVEADKIRLLAIGADQKLEDFPDVPTFKEVGVDADFPLSFRAILANPETDANRIGILEDAFLKAATSEKFNDFLSGIHFSSFTLNAEDTATFLDKEAKLYEEFYGK